MEFFFYTASKIVFKNGAIDEIGRHIDHLGRHFLLIIDPAFYNTPVMDKAMSQISGTGARCLVFSEVRGEPTVELVDEVCNLALENRCDAVISLGGGSAIDVGKAVAALITNDPPVLDYLEVVGKGKKIVNTPVPFIAIPTTAGTGSEVTKNSVIGSRAAEFKRSMRDDKMVATVAIIDPSLTIGCPPKVTAFSGIDALTHLIEAYITWRATPISDGLALKGIELVGKYLLRAYENGQDITARTNMSVAALVGGMAFANSGLGAAHGIGMAVGIRCHLAHGESCGIVLPHVVRLNADAAGDRLDRIGEVLTGRHFSKPGEGAKAAVNFLFDLNKALGIQPDYKFLNVPRAVVAEIAKASLGTSMTSNPKKMTAESLEAFLLKIM